MLLPQRIPAIATLVLIALLCMSINHASHICVIDTGEQQTATDKHQCYFCHTPVDTNTNKLTFVPTQFVRVFTLPLFISLWLSLPVSFLQPYLRAPPAKK